MRGKEASAKEQSQAETLHVIYEAMQRGIEFLPVDLYKSHSYKFLMEDGKIRLPFSAVKGLGGAAAQGLMDAREEGPLHFLRRSAGPQRHHQGGGAVPAGFGGHRRSAETSQMTFF